MSKSEMKLFKMLQKRAGYDSTTNTYSICVDINGDIQDPECVMGDSAEAVFYSAVSLYQDRMGLSLGSLHGISSPVLERSLEYLTIANFNAPHMKVVDEHTVPPQTEALYEVPYCIPELPLFLLYTDNYVRTRISNDCVRAFPCSFGTRDGIPGAVVTGISSAGIQKNLQKMQENVHKPDNISQELMFSALLMLIDDLGYEPQQLVIEVPELEPLVEFIERYPTSSAMAPFSDVTTIITDQNGMSKISHKPPKTKKGMARELAELIIAHFEKITTDQDRVFPCSVISVSSMKYEILDAFSCKTLDEVKDMHNKVRLFFIDPPQDMITSAIALVGILGHLSMPGVDIGAKLPTGQYMGYWVGHSAGTGFVRTKEFDVIYNEYPELEEREYGEADVRAFDQSLIYSILMMVAVFFCTFYKVVDPLTRTVMGDLAFRLVFKYLYLKPLQTLFFVSGMMFSGKYETSHGNTIYQNLVMRMYIAEKLEKYKNHPKYYLLQLCVLSKLIYWSFSGDDFMISYPIIIRNVFDVSLDDYSKFAKRCGLTFKYANKKALYAKVINTKTGAGWLTKQVREGVCFLKIQMAEVYEDIDGKMFFIGIYPFRPTADLFFRLGNSDKANGYIDSLFAKILSLAHLSFANREVFTYLGYLFYFLNKKLKWDGIVDFERLEAFFGGSGFMYQASQALRNSGTQFPQIVDLMKKHDNWEVKESRIPVTFKEMHQVHFNKDAMSLRYKL